MSCTTQRILRASSLSSPLRTSTTTSPHILRKLRPCPNTHLTLPVRSPLHHLIPSFPISPSHRAFSTSPPHHVARTIEEAKARQRSGPFSARAAILFVLVGAGLIVYFRVEKQRMDRRRITEASKGVGKPKIGGEFDLVDQEGRRFASGDMRGGFTIVYFGFTHCPDICPEELDKLSRIIDIVASTSTSRSSLATSLFNRSGDTSSSTRQPLLPLFITCDPARDTPGVLKSYLQEFHHGIVGLTGTWEQIKDMCKKYRVYFSTPEGVKPGEDYLVDHSIYFYLMDPDGDFVEAIGREHSAERAAEVIIDHMSDWRDGKKVH